MMNDKMFNTKLVRAVMRSAGKNTIYTNKLKGNRRAVKCYASDDEKKNKALIDLIVRIAEVALFKVDIVRTNYNFSHCRHRSYGAIIVHMKAE